MIRKNKNYLNYYVWFGKIKDSSRRNVATITGRTIKSSDPVFLAYMTSGMSGPSYPVKFNKHSYNVVDEATGNIVAKVDDRFNVYNELGIYSGSLHNVTRIFNYAMKISVSIILIFLIILILLLRTTVDSVKPKDIYITEGEMVEVSDEWNIFGETENDKVIMPGKKGVYYFSIHNTNHFDIVCTISFKDDNEHDIAMKYRLRKDTFTYLKGSSKKYLEVEEMTTKEIVIPAKSYVTLALDWYWDEDVNHQVDTNAGSSAGADYTVYVNIFAEEKTK